MQKHQFKTRFGYYDLCNIDLMTSFCDHIDLSISPSILYECDCVMVTVILQAVAGLFGCSSFGPLQNFSHESVHNEKCVGGTNTVMTVVLI